MTTAFSTDVQWLRGMPRCRAEGSTVYMTVALEPSRLTGAACVAWSADGLHATTPRIKGPTVTCRVPRGIFEHGALVRLQIVSYAEPDQPVLAWTQIPVVEETMLRAGMAGGRPMLSPLTSPILQTTASSALSLLDY